MAHPIGLSPPNVRVQRPAARRPDPCAFFAGAVTREWDRCNALLGRARLTRGYRSGWSAIQLPIHIEIWPIQMMRCGRSTLSN